MQVNVTVSINGPTGQELAAVIGPETTLVILGGESVEVPNADLREFVAAIERVTNAD